MAGSRKPQEAGYNEALLDPFGIAQGRQYFPEMLRNQASPAALLHTKATCPQVFETLKALHAPLVKGFFHPTWVKLSLLG